MKIQFQAALLLAGALFSGPALRASGTELDSTGWSWVYQGIGQAQTFTATGARPSHLSLRLARLNPRPPAAPLSVEIRGLDMQVIHGRGEIPAALAGERFSWVRVELDPGCELEPGQVYLIFVHSVGSLPEAPWLVNAIYRDAYPQGQMPGRDHDHLFRLEFLDGPSIQVGPKGDSRRLPISSGGQGGTEAPPPVRVQGLTLGGNSRAKVPEARDCAIGNARPPPGE